MQKVGQSNPGLPYFTNKGILFYRLVNKSLANGMVRPQSRITLGPIIQQGVIIVGIYLFSLALFYSIDQPGTIDFSCNLIGLCP